MQRSMRWSPMIIEEVDRGGRRPSGQLRRFYEEQVRDCPDWHIDVEEVVELGDSVVVRAHAQGSVKGSGTQRPTALDWLTHYRFRDGRITEINLLTVVPRQVV